MWCNIHPLNPFQGCNSGVLIALSPLRVWLLKLGGLALSVRRMHLVLGLRLWAALPKTRSSPWSWPVSVGDCPPTGGSCLGFNGHSVSSTGSPLLISDHQSLYLKARFLVGNLTVCIFLDHWPSSPNLDYSISSSWSKISGPLDSKPPSLGLFLCVCLRVRIGKNKGQGYESSRKLNCTKPPEVQIDILYSQKDCSSL